MNKKYFFIIPILFISFSAHAQNIWTLQQCVDTALVNNRKVKMQSLTKQERDIAYNQARLNLLPDLTAGAGQSFTFGRSLDGSNDYHSSTNSFGTTFNINSNLTIFNGLRLKHSIDARKSDAYASEADLENMEKDIIISVNTAFLQVLMNKELLRIAEEQLSLTKESVKDRKVLIENGKLPEGELYELLSQEAQEEMKKIDAEGQLKLSLMDLAQIIEIDDFMDMDVSVTEKEMNRELILPTAESVYENALKTHPSIKGAEHRLQSSEKNVSIARSGFYPTLSFNAQTGSNYIDLKKVKNDSFDKQMSDNLSTAIGLNLSVPIFNRLDTRNKVKTAQLDVENNKLMIEDTKRELQKTIQQAHYNALISKARWDASLKSEKAMQEAFRFVNQKYLNGRASQYELFQAKTNLTQTLTEQTQAKFEYIFRLRILELLR